MKTAGEIAFAIWYSGNYCPCAARSLPSRDRRRRVSIANLEPFSICEHPPINGASVGREAWRGCFARYRAAL